MTNFTIRHLERDDFFKLYNEHRATVFENDHSYFLRDVLSQQEKDHIAELRKNLGNEYYLYIAAFDEKDNFVGWSWGFQENATTFYMCNSAVLPEYRRKGLYSKILDNAISTLKDKGFQVIYSRHCATNNSVIIPKLKAGFTISKMELDDIFGVLIHLIYYTNQTRRKIIDYRSGQLAPDDEVKKILKI
ncbi:acetyltransferase, GNAT family [Bacteriovorax sp. BSW11_IV]|uniref:GNAT family N-acetyltransferase n=1 Tax=Bacteriovorax sp. BSW11_IV TaxID=1353529 RepID=UPI00038A3753|nr:GNAT family N-acetyltransferase [Bacteriovorax sp. BSW11_IV]EQC50193.1 acetyltransferase, GNAT family [Bacteriovorax sp. BSW11_IV]